MSVQTRWMVQIALRCYTGLWKIHDNYSLESTPQVLSRLQNKRVGLSTYFTTGKFTEKNRFRRLSSCGVIIRKNAVLAVENILMFQASHFYTTVVEYSTRVDRDQAASFMHEYRQSLDKNQFISDKQQQCNTLLQVCLIFFLSFIIVISF